MATEPTPEQQQVAQRYAESFQYKTEFRCIVNLEREKSFLAGCVFVVDSPEGDSKLAARQNGESHDKDCKWLHCVLRVEKEKAFLVGCESQVRKSTLKEEVRVF